MRPALLLVFCFLLLFPVYAQDAPETVRLGGQGYAFDMALSPDKNTLAVATETGLWLHDAATLAEILHVDMAPLQTVRWHSDGDKLLVIDNPIRSFSPPENDVYVIDVTNGDLLHQIEITDTVRSLDAIWVDDDVLIYGQEDNNAPVILHWDGELTPLWQHDGVGIINNVRVDDELIYFEVELTENVGAYHINLESGEISDVNVSIPSAGTLSPDGQYRVFIESGQIQVIDADNNILLDITSEGLFESRFARPIFEWSDDNTLLVHSLRSLDIYRWTFPSGEALPKISATDGSEIQAVTLDSGSVFIWLIDGLLLRYGTDGDILAEHWHSLPTIFDFDWSTDGSSIITTDFFSPLVRQWDAQNGDLLNSFEGMEQPASSVVWSPADNWFAAAPHPQIQQEPTAMDVVVWDDENGEIIQRLTIPEVNTADVFPLTADNTGQYLGTASLSNQTGVSQILIWDVETGELTFEADLPSIAQLEFSHDSQSFFICGLEYDNYDAFCQSFDLTTYEAGRKMLLSERAAPRAIDMHPGDTFLAIVDSDDQLSVVNTASMRIVDQVMLPAEPETVAWSPDGTRLIVGYRSESGGAIYSVDDVGRIDPDAETFTIRKPELYFPTYALWRPTGEGYVAGYASTLYIFP